KRCKQSTNVQAPKASSTFKFTCFADVNLGVALWVDREIRCNFLLNGVPFATLLGTPLLLRSLPQDLLPVGRLALLFRRF
ncbi:MAG: hypothetical protein WCK04_06490, partial [Actinomycetes bacterium]